jgi:hypothetical protein
MISLRAHFFALEQMSIISSTLTFQKSGRCSSPGISNGLNRAGLIPSFCGDEEHPHVSSDVAAPATMPVMKSRLFMVRLYQTARTPHNL